MYSYPEKKINFICGASQLEIFGFAPTMKYQIKYNK